MTTLITGASGFLGAHFLAKWPEPGIAVSRRRPSQLGEWRWCPRVQILAEPKRAELVIHLEVKQHVPVPSPRDIEDFAAVNVEGTRTWLRWSATSEVERFIYFSSIKAVNPAAIGPTGEEAGGPGCSAYGRSKWEAEQLVREWAQADPRRAALILRPAVVYGVGSQANMAAMVGAVRRGRFFLVGENCNVKSVVSATNLVSATRYLAGRMRPGSCEVFNLCDAEALSVRELDGLIRRQFGRSGNSPAIPVALARAGARAGDWIHRLSGILPPLTSARLQALLESTHFTCDKLIQSGFVHPQTTAAGLAELANG